MGEGLVCITCHVMQTTPCDADHPLPHVSNASPSEKIMKTALVLLLAVLLGLSVAEYRRTASYEGEVVVRWYVSSVSLRPHACRPNFDFLFHLHACSTGGDRERLRSLLEHNGTDVWGAGPDGVVIRMPKALYHKIHSRFSECTLQVEDLEIYVREWEKTVQRGADQATWFEEYVSGTENSGPFAYAEHVEYTTSQLLWGWGGGGGDVFHPITSKRQCASYDFQDIKICTALEFLCCCVCLYQSWPIACTLY